MTDEFPLWAQKYLSQEKSVLNTESNDSLKMELEILRVFFKKWKKLNDMPVTKEFKKDAQKIIKELVEAAKDIEIFMQISDRC